MTWFGYKLYLIVDAIYELPLGYKLTKASVLDCPQLLPVVEELDEKHSQIVEGAETLAADRGHDSKENNGRLYDDYGIKPLIDIRAMWKDNEERLVFDRVDNIVYDEFGKVYCENSSSTKNKNSIFPFKSTISKELMAMLVWGNVAPLTFGVHMVSTEVQHRGRKFPGHHTNLCSWLST